MKNELTLGRPPPALKKEGKEDLFNYNKAIRRSLPGITK
jgi:hypothetical protein